MKETDMGFETCRMTCEADTDRLGSGRLIAVWRDHGSPPKSRGEEIVRRSVNTENEWVNIEWAPGCVTCFKQNSPRAAVDLVDRIRRLFDRARLACPNE